MPGGPEEIIRNLMALLRDLAENPAIDRSFTVPGTETSVPLRKILNTLGTCGLMRREGYPTRMILTEDARYFLESGDELFLVAVIHANVRFIGEALASIGDGTTHDELHKIAGAQYGLKWESLDQIRRRVYWLRAAGLAEFWSNGQIVPTEKARNLLGRLELVAPDDLSHRRQSTQPVEIPSPPPLLAAHLASATQASLRSRKRQMGYVSGGWRVETLNRLVNAAVPDITRDAFKAFCVAEFDVAESSAEQSLHTLRAFGLLEQVGSDTFAATELAASCLASNEPLDLIRLLHLNVALLGETLDALDAEANSRSLGNFLAERYPSFQVSREDITTRVALLLEVGLAERIGLVIRRTDLGTALMQSLPLLDWANSGADSESPAEQDDGGFPDASVTVDTIANAKLAAEEVVRSSTDSANYQRFERAIAAAFRLLGVEVEAHGGPSKTDVTVGLWQSPTSRLRVAVEAKTDGEGLVTDQDVKFLRLGEHRQLHQAQCTVIVGPQFDARVEQEAAREKVALLTAQELADAVVRHAHTPLTPQELSGLVTAGGTDALEKAWKAAERRQVVVGHVLHTMWRCANDPVDIEFTAGVLGIGDIWRETKSALPLDRSEIEQVLAFLETPFMAGVAKVGSEHVAAAPPSLIAARLHALANAIDSASTGRPADTKANESLVALEPPALQSNPDSEKAAGNDAAAVRAWAQAQGRTVNMRGRLPDSLIKEYRRANGLFGS